MSGGLIQAHNIDDVCNVTKVLLDHQVFESVLKAKIRFSGAFEVQLYDGSQAGTGFCKKPAQPMDSAIIP